MKNKNMKSVIGGQHRETDFFLIFFLGISYNKKYNKNLLNKYKIN